MTSYVAIPNGDIDQDSPITQPLMTALRDNPVAIAEGDASVPEILRNTRLLGTLITTSGTTQTLSGLDLTNLQRLICVVDSVSFAGLSPRLRIDSLACSASLSAADVVNGMITVDLNTGVYLSGVAIDQSTPTADVFADKTSYRKTSTSITFSTSGGSFDAGSILVFGVK